MIAVILGCLIVLFALVVTFQSGRNESAATSRERATQRKLDEAQITLDAIVSDRQLEQDEEDCRDLYKDDILFADARAQAQNAKVVGLVISLIGQAPEERATTIADLDVARDESDRLVDEVFASMDAFTDYIESLPFEGCDHPRWPKGRSNEPLE
jgi:hypothetical protein